MDRRIVILGSGTGGTLTANRLRRHYDESEFRIIAVDQDDDHVHRPGLVCVPFGLAEPKAIVRPRHLQLHDGIGFRRAKGAAVDLDADRVHFTDGTSLGYEVLVLATGTAARPEEIQGLAGPGRDESVFTLHDLPGVLALRSALAAFEGGRLVAGVAGMPGTCPAAALEFCFLADRYFHRRGIRDRVDLAYVTPLDGAFARPAASRVLGRLLEAKGIELVTGFTAAAVDGKGGRLVSYDGREVPFDLAAVVPPHSGAAYVGRSPGLGDERGFVAVDRRTLRSTARPNVFAIGDATGTPGPELVSAAHSQGQVLVNNIRRFLAGRPLDGSFDGPASGFVETGFGKALLVDFGQDTEPLFMKSRLNHFGRRASSWLYWNSVLPGRELPGIGSATPRPGRIRRRVPAGSIR
ncbi:NAD(P)/FAD-dependent oxidoreductase [Streptomyces sp. NBC_01262]|uniref:NAD(P)/FAD-dependent oxidoreductase n=1 Tax=Streptomyces sp. NBC_01262 TaxID=2903803 RepID=UPI002E2EAAEE|nr:FAD/NAD(P)-binding oxidoreductase [Streptomyces sp. NBC_01262]